MWLPGTGGEEQDVGLKNGSVGRKKPVVIFHKNHKGTEGKNLKSRENEQEVNETASQRAAPDTITPTVNV